MDDMDGRVLNSKHRARDTCQRCGNVYHRVFLLLVPSEPPTMADEVILFLTS